MLNNQLVIRPIMADEAALLTAIHAECFAHYWNMDAFNDFFSVPGTFAFVAERPLLHDGRKEVGMVVCRMQYEEVDIMTVAVRPGWRKQGIARALITEAIDKVKALGAKKMFLDVEDGNIAAIRLYESFGFTQINRRKQYYRQKDNSFTDALVMKCKLS